MTQDNGSPTRCPSVAGNSGKLDTYDYFYDVPESLDDHPYVEVQFKNTRKEFFLNNLRLPLAKGDMVAVEASPGHDIGRISLTGRLVDLQMRKLGITPPEQPKTIYRLARPLDLQKYEESKAKEHETMIGSRQIAKRLGLDMKIGDVEYQGDGQKAIFYYIADHRVDFRQLIRELAEAFHIRVEMRQIGARQEAGRIGGIGPCGRQLCCSGWMTGFHSVSTNVARLQDIAINPQKLAGQCAKLKCCLNYERDTYAEAQSSLPPRDVRLECQRGVYAFLKADTLAGQVSYISTGDAPSKQREVVTISKERALEVIDQNRADIQPVSLVSDTEEEQLSGLSRVSDILSEESLSRFDKSRDDSRPKRSRNGRNRRRPQGGSSGRSKGARQQRRDSRK